MKDIVLDFLANNASQIWTQIWTLLSVVAGGIVTYITTSRIESKKSKRQFQQKKLEEILIPYCTCLEKVKDTAFIPYGKDESFEVFFKSLREPLVYLQAAKRAYLSQNERKKLISYKESVDALEKALNDDANHCHISCVGYLEAKLRKFPDGEGTMNIYFSFAKGADKAIKCSLLAGKPLLMSHYLTSVQFCYNDDPENFQSKTIDISKDVRSIWDGLSYSVYDLADVGDKFNVEELEQGCELLDFMKENLTDEADNWAKYSQELKSPSIFFNLLDNLNLMIDEITKTIDTITA